VFALWLLTSGSVVCFLVSHKVPAVVQLIRKTSKDFEKTRPRQRGKSASMPLRNEREISSTWSPDTPLSEGIVTFHFRWSTAFSSAVRLSEKITIKTQQTHWGATLFALLNLLITGFRSEILTASESNFYYFPAIPLWPQHMSELSSSEQLYTFFNCSKYYRV